MWENWNFLSKNIRDRILFEIDPLYSGQVHHLLHVIHKVPSGVCIYIPGYVYIPFPEIGYVKGMYLIEKVCKTAFTTMFLG